MKGSAELKQRISKEKGISGKKLDGLVGAKQEEFAGLLSEEAAVFAIAKGLGMEVDATPPPPIFTRISDLADGMKGVSVRGRILRAYALKEFQRDGRKGSLVSLVLDDGSASVRIVLWDLDAVKVEEGGLEKGDEAEVLNAFVKSGLGGLEMQLGMTGSLKRVVKEEKHPVSKVSALEEGKEYDVVARVLEVGKKSGFERNGKQSAVGWCLVGDETGTVRLVLWDTLADLVGKLKVNDILKVEGGLARSGMGGELEFHVSWGGRVLVNPRGAEVAGAERPGAPLRKIADLVEGERAEVRAALSEIVSVKDSPSRFAEAIFTDDDGKLVAEFQGKAALGLLGLKSLADDIALSTVLGLKGKELACRESYLLGKLEKGVFRAESLVGCVKD